MLAMNYHTETAFVNRLFSVDFIFYIFINVVYFIFYIFINVVYFIFYIFINVVYFIFYIFINVVYFIFYIFINVIPIVRTFISAAVYRLCVSAAVVVQSLWQLSTDCGCLRLL